MPPPAAPPQPPTARSLPDACIAEDELRAAVARAGREAAWLAAQRPISACLAAAVSARATCHDARAVRAVALCIRSTPLLCTYGPDASVLFPDQHCMMTQLRPARMRDGRGAASAMSQLCVSCCVDTRAGTARSIRTPKPHAAPSLTARTDFSQREATRARGDTGRHERRAAPRARASGEHSTR